MEIQWQDSDGLVYFRGGGELKPGPIWERYLGSQLAPGSYSISVLVRGMIFATRHFEVLPNDLAVSAAERLTRWPQYFELVTEEENDSSTEVSNALEGEVSTVPTPLVSTRVEPKAKPRTTVERSSQERQQKDREWLRKDVERFAPKRSSRSLPKTAEERLARELAWIRADVATHAAHLKRTPPAAVQPKEMEAAEMQRREKEWMAKEAQKLRAFKAQRLSSASVDVGDTLDQAGQGLEPWIQKDIQQHESLRRQRCEDLKNRSLHQVHEKFLTDACHQLFNISMDPIIPTSTSTSKDDAEGPDKTKASKLERSDRRPAKPNDSIADGMLPDFQKTLTDVKQRLKGSIPDHIVEKAPAMRHLKSERDTWRATLPSD